MSGRRSRSKGARTERGIVNALKANGIAAVARPAVWLGRRPLRGRYRAVAARP